MPQAVLSFLGAKCSYIRIRSDKLIKSTYNSEHRQLCVSLTVLL